MTAAGLIAPAGPAARPHRRRPAIRPVGPTRPDDRHASGRPGLANGRLRVGLICPYSFDTHGGVQNHVVGLARFLIAQGHDVAVLAPGDPVPDLRLPAGRFTSAGPAVRVPYNGSVARVSFGPRVGARVREWLRAGAFDLVHTHEPITPSIALHGLWAAEVPVVATFHTATPRSRSMQLAGATLQGSVAKIAGRIAVSPSALDVVTHYLGRDADVIPNGFDSAAFGDRTHAAGPWRGGAAPRLTFLGRDEPRKGLGTLLAALPAIRAVHPDLDVVVAGEGTARVGAGVRALGPIDDRRKRALLAATDVFVAPQLERESFGIVLLEAMAAGAAVLASDLVPFVDVLTGGAGPLGELFPRGDAAGLAAGALRLLGAPDPDRRSAAAHAAAAYDWSVVGPRVVEVYRAAVATSGWPG